MENSILKGTKLSLGLETDYTPFDFEIITLINSALATLTQLGIGPTEGFMISDETAVWDQFIGDDARFNQVKTYVYLKTKMLFDPPNTGYLVTAMIDVIKETEHRLSEIRESDIPLPVVVVEE